MKIYQLQPSINEKYAQLMSLYVENDAKPLCSTCEYLPPFGDDLLLEWEPGSDIIPDFISALGRIVAKEQIVDKLMQNFIGLRKKNVNFYDHPKLYKPKNFSKRTKPCVWLPYDGPSLVELVTNHSVPIHEQSTVAIEEECSDCGRIIYESFNYIEEKNSSEHIQRAPGKGLFFEKSLVGDRSFFNPECTGMIVCTEKAREYILSEGYSNLDMLEVGELI